MSVLNGLYANAALRALSGFLIFFLAFLLREHPLAGQSAAVSLGIVGVSAGGRQRAGHGGRLAAQARGPEVLIVTMLTIALGAAVLSRARSSAA